MLSKVIKFIFLIFNFFLKKINLYSCNSGNKINYLNFNVLKFIYTIKLIILQIIQKNLVNLLEICSYLTKIFLIKIILNNTLRNFDYCTGFRICSTCLNNYNIYFNVTDGLAYCNFINNINNKNLIKLIIFNLLI